MNASIPSFDYGQQKTLPINFFIIAIQNVCSAISVDDSLGKVGGMNSISKRGRSEVGNLPGVAVHYVNGKSHIEYADILPG